MDFAVVAFYGIICREMQDCTVLVCSCDKYADILPAFVALWRRFWPDCPFETVLVTETDPGLGGFDRTIACGAGGTWCSRLVKALDEISTSCVLMLCDDYFLSQKVDTAQILHRLAQMREFGAGNLRLIPNPSPSDSNSEPFAADDGLFRYRPKSAYCIATQAGLWDRAFLRGLADGRASIWEFERYGSFDDLVGEMPVLGTAKKEFPFVDAVHKGHWERFGVDVCRENGVDISSSARTLPPLRVRLVEGAKGLVFRIFPWNWIVRAQNAIGAGAKERH